MAQKQSSILALDVGRRRIGVAIADTVARIPSALTTITQSDQIEAVADLVKEHGVSEIVVGLPRSMDGSDSSQTKEVQQFAGLLKKKVNLPVHLQDEAVTSVQAEEELRLRGKPYTKEDIDALSATYILDDFLGSDVLHDKLGGSS